MSSSQNKVRAQALIDYFADIAARVLHRHTVDSATAANASREIASEVQSEFAGQLIYIPFGLSKKEARDRAMLAEYQAGADVAAIARKHGVSMQWAYKRIAALSEPA